MVLPLHMLVGGLRCSIPFGNMSEIRSAFKLVSQLVSQHKTVSHILLWLRLLPCTACRWKICPSSVHGLPLALPISCC